MYMYIMYCVVILIWKGKGAKKKEGTDQAKGSVNITCHYLGLYVVLFFQFLIFLIFLGKRKMQKLKKKIISLFHHPRTSGKLKFP